MVFFLMFTVLGLGTLNGIYLGIVDGLAHSFRGSIAESWKIMLGLCALTFTMGLTILTRSGNMWLEMMNYYSSWMCLAFVLALETLILTFGYGMESFVEDIEVMLRQKLPLRRFWLVAWKYVSPAFAVGIMVVSLYNTICKKKFDMLGSKYPFYANLIGYGMPLSIILLIAAGFVHARLHKQTQMKDETFFCRSSQKCLLPATK